MRRLHRVEFIWDFVRKNKLDGCFNKIYFNNSLLNAHYNANHIAPKVIFISLFPSFLTHEIVKHKDYHLKTIQQFNFKGAGITFDETFKLKKLIPRLEKSFDISYEYNFGHISEEKCEFLLGTLHDMLKRRFNQKKEQNNYILFWEAFTKDIYSSINQKKTSLFVVYDREKPINISLNYHIGDCIMHSEINAFDIDYSKYGLGHFGNKLLINWCINNKYRFLDMGNGLIGYKTHICNTFYDFEYYIYYKKKSISALTLAYKEIMVLHIKNLIKSYLKKLNTIKQMFIVKNTASAKTANYSTEMLCEKTQISDNNLKPININNDNYSFLRKPVYDYLFETKQHINSVLIYELVSNRNNFLIKGSTSNLKINFKR